MDAATVNPDSGIGGMGGISTATGGVGGSTAKTGGAGGTAIGGAGGTTATAGGAAGTTTGAGGGVVVDAASDAPCSLPTTLTFGYNGGWNVSPDVNQLDQSGILTVTRTFPASTADAGSVMSCSQALPPCGTPGSITVATIAADLADPDVRAGFAATSTLYGLDFRPSDGIAFTVVRADGHTIVVGSPCYGGVSDSCLATPAGVQRLNDDLTNVATATLAAPACQGLSAF